MKRIIISILLLSIVAVYSCSSSTEENKIESRETQEIKTLFDIPNLLGRSFSSIQKSLGNPTKFS